MAATFVRCLIFGLLSGLSMSTMAHESRPIYVELKQTPSHQYQLQWKTPPSLPAPNLPTVSLPNTCEPRSPMAEFEGTDGLIRRRSYQCRDDLAGQAILISYPSANPSVSSLIRYETLSGERHIVVLGPQELQWIVPAAETALGLARQYTRLGMHIWAGVDHLLFLVCLLWIARSGRCVLITVTGFTLAHSVTLILSALQMVRLGVAPVEAASP